MEIREFKNMVKALAILSVVTIIVLAGLWSLSYSTGAGSESFHIGSIIVLLQAMVIAASYVMWYLDVNRSAADLINIEEMRRAAFRRILPYWFISLLITGAIGAAAGVGFVLQMIFVDINQVYCLSASIMELVAGNFTLLLLMRFWGLPDRVLGRY